MNLKIHPVFPVRTRNTRGGLRKSRTCFRRSSSIGATMRVIDGLHRMRAAQLRCAQTIEAQFFTGDDDAAFLLAVEANIAHGLPLSLSERKAAAVRLIAMFPDRSDRSIAASAGISDKTVAGLRSSAENPRSNARTGVDGRRRPVDGADRRRRAARLVARQPHTPIRDIAKEAEISVATALDVRRRVTRGEDPVPPGVNRVGGGVVGRHLVVGRSGGIQGATRTLCCKFSGLIPL